MLTGKTITDDQIRELRGAEVRKDFPDADWSLVSLCTVALKRMSSTDSSWLMEPYRTPALRVHALAVKARAYCAEILNARSTESP